MILTVGCQSERPPAALDRTTATSGLGRQIYTDYLLSV